MFSQKLMEVMCCASRGFCDVNGGFCKILYLYPCWCITKVVNQISTVAKLYLFFSGNFALGLYILKYIIFQK